MANVTLHDVARAAGVSHTTVSWALKADPRITEATRARVIAVARELGYVPNEVARCLAQGRTQTIAIVSATFSAAFESETLRGIEAEMIENHADWSLVQYSTGVLPERPGLIYEQLLRGNKADAVICLTDAPDAALRQAYRAARKPLVVFDENITDSAAICGDSKGGTELATNLLLDCGCLRPGIVSSRPLEDGKPRCDPKRLNTFMEICASRGIQGRSLPITRYHFDAGQALAATIRQEAWDGVYCAAGDMVAIGIMAGCRELGVRIPEDLRIVGYDNLLVSAMVQPPLTTITQALADMGRAAVRTCFGLLDDYPADSPMPRLVYAPSLVRRASA